MSETVSRWVRTDSLGPYCDKGICAKHTPMAARDLKALGEGTKYRPLYEHLANLPATTTRITLTFVQIEKIMGHELPGSASDQHNKYHLSQREMAF